MVAAALISAGASLLGGLFAPKPKWVTPNYQQIRDKAEAAGFNPLTALTSAPGQAMQGENYMGAAIADAGLMLADAFAKNKRGQMLSKVQAENAQLKDKVQSLTLRPKVGGVYAARQAVPTVRQALGVSNAALSGSATSAVSASGVGASGSAVADFGMVGAGRGLPDAYPIDPRRAVEHSPIKSSAGVMMVDSPWADRPIPMLTLDGDEPLALTDIPKLGMGYSLGGVVQRAVSNAGQPKRPSLDVRNPSAASVAAGDRYNNALGRQRPGQWRDPGSPIRKHYAADTSAYWAWPKRDAWPKFQLGY
jgi:hypothetical protein